eukprot:g65988.t1
MEQVPPQCGLGLRTFPRKLRFITKKINPYRTGLSLAMDHLWSLVSSATLFCTIPTSLSALPGFCAIVPVFKGCALVVPLARMLRLQRANTTVSTIALVLRKLHVSSRSLDLRSQLFAPTLKVSKTTTTGEAHSLLLRAGYIRQLQSGSFLILPLGQRVLDNVERVIDKHLQALGCGKVSMPHLMPRTLWDTTGRWDSSGQELFRLKDRRGSDMCLGPTHEEAITWLAKQEVSSYRDLPLKLYQITTKFRDEERPRGGLLRGKEFIMKDLYSFDCNKPQAQETYESVSDAYVSIFKELGLPVVKAAADSGSIGGQLSHEFHVISEHGEDDLVRCRACGLAWNAEKPEGSAQPPYDTWLEDTASELSEQRKGKSEVQQAVDAGENGNDNTAGPELPQGQSGASGQTVGVASRQAAPQAKRRAKPPATAPADKRVCPDYCAEDPRAWSHGLAALLHKKLPMELLKDGLDDPRYYRCAVVRVEHKTEAVFRQEEQEEDEDNPIIADTEEEKEVMKMDDGKPEYVEQKRLKRFLVLTRRDRALSPLRMKWQLNALDLEVLEPSHPSTLALLRGERYPGDKGATDAPANDEEVGLLVDESLCTWGVDLDAINFRREEMLKEQKEREKKKQGAAEKKQGAAEGEKSASGGGEGEGEGENKDVMLCGNYPYASQGHFSEVREGDKCIKCQEDLSIDKGIEVGHVFYLGTKYSRPFEATYQNKEGKQSLIRMGCYGIGVSRVMAAFVESMVGHDSHGITWSMNMAPYRVCLLSLGKSNEVQQAAQSIYNTLQGCGEQMVEGSVLWDDRASVSSGVKFKEALLQGYPVLVVVGSDALARNVVEVQRRQPGVAKGVQTSEVPLDQLATHIIELCKAR